METKIYLIDTGKDKRITKTVAELLTEVNEDRNPEWLDYNITDVIVHGIDEILGWLDYKMDNIYYSHPTATN